MRRVYLDNGATTQVDKNVLEKMNLYFDELYGNASSIHTVGTIAKKALDESREIIAKSLNAHPKEIYFTSGGTESNNLAIKGLALTQKKEGKFSGHIITSKIEHDCVLNTCQWLETLGFDVTYLDVDKQGFIDLQQLKDSIKEDTFLVSIIHGNNEIGTIQDLKAIYEICKKNKIFFHTDACQSYTKVPISTDVADMITINAHKIHGPKGVGGLYIRDGIKIVPLNHGGGQERQTRCGTENISGIVGFSEAVKVAKSTDIKKMKELRDDFISKILQIPNTQLNGATEEKRLCNNINVSFDYIEGESIIYGLDIEGIACSTGSACSSKSLDPSHVMMALEDNPGRAHGSVRFTVSKYTTKEDITYTLEKLKEIIRKLREISPLRGE
jgi:cysteine desulfurase